MRHDPSGLRASIHGRALDIRSARAPRVSVATPMRVAASSRSFSREVASLLDMSTRSSPSRRVTSTGRSSAAANTRVDAS